MARNMTLLVVAIVALMLVPVGCGESLPAPSPGDPGSMTEAEKRLDSDLQNLTQKAQAPNKSPRRARR